MSSYGVLVQPDEQIVIGGPSFDGQTNNFALVRLRSDGTLDSGFGSGGIVTTDLGGDDYCVGLALDGSTRILAAGFSVSPLKEDMFFVAIRYR